MIREKCMYCIFYTNDYDTAINGSYVINGSLCLFFYFGCETLAPMKVMVQRSHVTMTFPFFKKLPCLPAGYFLQDAGDIILTGHTKESWEFLLHHVLVMCIICTGLILFSTASWLLHG